MQPDNTLHTDISLSGDSYLVGIYVSMIFFCFFGYCFGVIMYLCVGTQPGKNKLNVCIVRVWFPSAQKGVNNYYLPVSNPAPTGITVADPAMVPRVPWNPLFCRETFLCTSSVQYAKSPCLRGHCDVWFQLLRATRYSIELPDSGIPRHFRGRVRVQYFRIFRMRINEWLRAHICRQLYCYSCVFCHGGGIDSYVNVLMNNSRKRPSSGQ